MTAQGSVEAAVEAVASGASDFIGKPSRFPRWWRCCAAIWMRAVRRRSAPAPSANPTFRDPAWWDVARPWSMVYKLIAQAARTDATVLIMGESGTGKELVARAIHDFSRALEAPVPLRELLGPDRDAARIGVVRPHAAALSPALQTERAGLFEAADGGTLFLDELASTSPAFQASLLRVLQSGEVRRVGATQPRRVNVRVIGASNAPLRDLVAAGSFRSDLYYRLSVLSIELPPLRERTGDVELLTAAFPAAISRAGPTAAASDARGHGGACRRTVSRATCANWKMRCGAPWRSPPTG